MLLAPTPDYELLATSVLNVTFLQSCMCIHVALTGNAVESLVIAAVAHFCPMLTLTSRIKPDIQTDGSLVVTDKFEDVKEIAMNYSSILMFYTGHQMTLNTDRTLAVLAVVQERDTFLALDAADKTVLGQWNPDTNLVAIVESPWLQVIRKSRLKRLRAPKVAIFECPPYVTYHNVNLNANEKAHYDGIELRIVEAALRNFNIRFVPQDSSFSDKLWIKVTDDLGSGEADVGVPIPNYELLADSVLNATFLQSCTCIHVALTGNAVEFLVIAAVAHFCPMLTLTSGIKPDIQTDGSLVVTDKPEDVKQVAMNYSSILMFYTGHQMTLDTDRTLAVLAVVQECDTFLVLDAADKTVLGQWNPDTNLVAIVESPWLQVIRYSRLIRLRAPKVAMFQCPPFVTYHNVNLSKDKQVHYDGIELRIIQAALRNFNVSFIPQNFSIWGGSWTQVRDDLTSGEADVGVCSIWLTANPPHGVQLSYPWSRQRGTFLAPKPQPLSPALLLFWTWIILFNTLLSFSLILHGVAKLLPLSSRYQNIHHCFFDVSRILMLDSLPKLPYQATLRYLLTAWAFFSLLTTTVYLSGFTSLLTSPLYSKPIDTIQDLLDQNIYWGDQSTGFNDLIISSDNPKLQEFGQKFVIERSPAERQKRILKGNYAIFCKVLSDTFVTESERLSPSARQMLRVMKEPVFIFYVGIGLRENSPYKSLFDSTIIRLEQGGLTDFWQHLVIYKLGHHYMNTFFSLQNDVIDKKPLIFTSVQGSFYLLGIGLTISSIIFLCEIVVTFFVG